MGSADETRARILLAATEEFSAHGIAGARVDRIAKSSGMSKPMIYAYFGSKDGLFDSVFQSHVVDNAERVPFTPHDLPAYAVALYDHYVSDPSLIRLIMWKRLEREATGYLFGGLEHLNAAHLAQLSGAQQAGLVRSDIPAEDVWSLLIATASTWAQASIMSVAAESDDDNAHARRRASLGSYVRVALAGTTAP